MCVSVKSPSPPPAPEPIPATPPQVVTTPQTAPATAGGDRNTSSTVAKKRLGRGSLRIPLDSSGLTGSGVNFPTS